jgi:hypothetical protein
MKLDSDFEHASALVAIGRQMTTATPAQVSSYLRSAQKIDSDFERRNVLTSFVSRNPLDKSGFLAVLQAIDGMDSILKSAPCWLAIAKRMPADNELINRYRRTARSLGDHEARTGRESTGPVHHVTADVIQSRAGRRAEADMFDHAEVARRILQQPVAGFTAQQITAAAPRDGERLRHLPRHDRHRQRTIAAGNAVAAGLNRLVSDVEPVACHAPPVAG